jgi:hypothetical protein
VWASQIGPILTALAGLVTAIAGLRSALLRRRSNRPTGGRRRHTPRRAAARSAVPECDPNQLLASLRHVYVLERYIVGHGLWLPERPELLRT